MADCNFCDIINGRKDDYKVWEDKDFIAILDINPAKRGHIMLIPKEHVEDVFYLSSDLYDSLFRVAKKLSEPLRAAMGAKRIGMALAGFTVPHAHLHLVPLHGPNEMFESTKFHRASHEELKKSQELIIEQVKKFISFR